MKHYLSDTGSETLLIGTDPRVPPDASPQQLQDAAGRLWDTGADVIKLAAREGADVALPLRLLQLVRQQPGGCAATCTGANTLADCTQSVLCA